MDINCPRRDELQHNVSFSSNKRQDNDMETRLSLHSRLEAVFCANSSSDFPTTPTAETLSPRKSSHYTIGWAQSKLAQSPDQLQEALMWIKLKGQKSAFLAQQDIQLLISACIWWQPKLGLWVF